MLPQHWVILPAQIPCFSIQTIFPSNRYFEGTLTLIIFFLQYVFIFRMHLHIPRISLPSQVISPKEKDVVSVSFKECLNQNTTTKTPTELPLYHLGGSETLRPGAQPCSRLRHVTWDSTVRILEPPEKIVQLVFITATGKERRWCNPERCRGQISECF